MIMFSNPPSQKKKKKKGFPINPNYQIIINKYIKENKRKRLDC